MDAGTLVMGRFEIERRAASGGMGAVYRAKDRVTGGHAAVKVVRVDGDENVERLLREGRALSQLDHPHVVRYLGHGTTPLGDPFLAMEWVEGETLSRRLGRAPMTIAETLALVMRVAEALGHAHAKGIVHRDVKPGNLILRDNDHEKVVLVDFGVARARVEEGLTMTGMLVGTPAFMAPEQARGSRSIDPAADVFALGCLLHRCLTGRNAFEADNQIAVLAKILLDDPMPLGALVEGIDPALGELSRSMLSKDPSKRPANGSAVAEAIRKIGTVTHEHTPGMPTERLTLTERRLVSLVLAPSPVDPEATITGDVPNDASAVRNVATNHGAVCELLANGTLVVALAHKGSATDQVARAARIALELREVLPSAPIALVTGRATVDANESSTTSGITRSGSADVFEHGAQLLAALVRGKKKHCVVIDETTAGLLDRSFVVGTHELGLELRTTRDTGSDAARLLGKVTSCVGRDRELATLDALLVECISEPIARAALVTAPPGMGKSRVLRELLLRSGSRAHVMRASCESFASGTPLSMIAQIVRGAAGIESDDTMEARSLKLRARVSRHLRKDVQRVAEFLGEVCGLETTSPRVIAARSDPRLMTQQIQSAWVDWMAAECGANPVLLVIDDVHWSDVMSMRLVQDALSALAESPFCVVALGRPEAFESLPLGFSERAVPVPLTALSKKACEKLVREALDDASEEVVARLVQRAAGQPLLLEELVRAHVEGQDDAGEIAAIAMVQSRLETLDPEARRVLRAASVFGESFWRAGVEALLQTSVGAHLDTLEGKELIAKRASSRMAGEQEIAFRHALVRDAAYEMLTPEDAALGHRLAAEWMQTKSGVDPAVVAEHWARSDRAPDAIPHLLLAAESALEAGDFDRVRALATRARSIGMSGEIEGRFRFLEADAARWLGDTRLAEEAALRAIALLRVGSAPWLNAVRTCLFSAGFLGHMDLLNQLVTELLEVHPLGDEAERAWLLAANQGASNLIVAGPNPLVEKLFDRTDRVSPERLESDPLLAVYHYLSRSNAAFRQGNYERLLETSRSSIEHALRAGDVRFAAQHTTNIGFSYGQLGDFETALDHLTAARQDALRYRLGTAILILDQNIGHILMCLERYEEAMELEESVVRGALDTAPRLCALGHSCLSRIHVRLGNVDRAIEHGLRAVEVSPTDVPRVYAHASLSEARIAAKQWQHAIDAASVALEMVRKTGGVYVGDVVAGRTLVEGLLGLGQEKEASEAIAGTYAVVRARAEMIRNPIWKKSFLERVEDNRRVLDLGSRLLSARALGA